MTKDKNFKKLVAVGLGWWVFCLSLAWFSSGCGDGGPVRHFTLAQGIHVVNESEWYQSPAELELMTETLIHRWGIGRKAIVDLTMTLKPSTTPEETWKFGGMRPDLNRGWVAVIDPRCLANTAWTHELAHRIIGYQNHKRGNGWDGDGQHTDPGIWDPQTGMVVTTFLEGVIEVCGFKYLQGTPYEGQALTVDPRAFATQQARRFLDACQEE